ncbi:LysR family transcriptional regulator [Streptomyces rapamycinicus]|uniref:DNA-binding transcriptional LysR family regulator n=1 Tax=Streptomyces rapamycinicus TaxID=1226757 RepID=A0ABR6LEU1_9ACTN|nr:LysR family transcriptional regulator [Streptomyces rapamycinicus]MBB4780854.1 DNA-binding transcriptional LysR family regulator [Streptomyces rapamycinicus]UTO61541.1 LysR family transcriptional regulator [Streptomyces rapamycinicus]UTP29488.1 LysR family transcriptional regulator [Streptomyces rapamycinicus NRRL 5491]
MDLNLLVALDALLEENSVTAAADRLNLSPPAMSRTLARIRRATGDDILVRAGRTMVPTPHALELREETRDLVRRATAVLTPVRRLDLAALNRHFTVRGHDALLAALAAPLIARVGATAPNIRLSLLAESSADRPDLARGQVDLELGANEPRRPELSSEVVGTDRVVLTLRRAHPLAKGRVDLDKLVRMTFVTVSRRGRLHDAIDEALAERGLRRRVVASLPTSAAALDVVSRSDTVAVVAERVCRPASARLGLVTRRLPLELPPTQMVLTWHHRHDSDPAHAWLRGQVRAVLREATDGT